MIFVTGDCHQEYSKFNTSNFPEQKKLSKDDYVIICGDFGGVWDVDNENKSEKYLLDWLEKKSFTTLFVDGNHENYDRLYAYPVEEWHGGKVHKIRPTVIHLMRGQIFEIGGKTFFTFGGARSHDILGGLLETEDADFRDKKRELDRIGNPYRINHLSWWAQELASEEEMKEGLANLEKHDYKIDYIITHCCSTTLQNILSNKGIYKPDAQTDYLDYIRKKCIYDKWYFGHYHDNLNPTSKEVLLYEQLLPLGDNVKESRYV